MYYWIGYGIPTVILLLALAYGVHRAGWLSPRERAKLDANTRWVQEREDPRRSSVSMPLATKADKIETTTRYAEGTRRMFAAAALIAAVLLVTGLAWPLLIQNKLGTPKGGANPATAPDTTASRGAPAQRAAESTVGKNNSNQQEANGARAKDIKQSSQPLQLDERQRLQIKQAISHYPDAPKLQKAPFEMMIGTAVPRQVELKVVPPEIAQAMNGFWGDKYVLIQGTMVIVDQHSQRVVAIVPSVG